MRRIFCSAALLLCFSCVFSLSAEAAFVPEYSVNTNGSFALASNSSMSCDKSLETCLAALSATGKRLNNNSFAGIYVDIDEDPTTFSSSAASLDIPEGAEILYAVLSWTGDKYATSAANIKIMAPGDTAYTSISADEFRRSGKNHAAWKDVTSLVASGGAGTYTVANILGDQGGTDSYAGWQLTAVYRDTDSPPRNITVFRDWQYIAQGTSVAVPVTGFTTPASDQVYTSVGIFALDGDLGSTGDRVALNGSYLANGKNPTNNSFNSTVSDFSEWREGRVPGDTNTLGVDSDTLAADGILENNTTQAEIRFETTSDQYYVPSLVFATDLYAPELHIQKTAEDMNGGDLEPGDTIRYHIDAYNSGTDAATNALVEDAIPANTTYVPGSMNIVSGPGGASTLSDAPDSDAGSFSAGKVSVRVGSGGTSQMQVGEETVLAFDVMVDGGTAPGTHINNEVVFSGNGFTLSIDQFVSRFHNQLVVVDRPVGLADLDISLNPAEAEAEAGDPALFQAEIVNRGSAASVDPQVVFSLGSDRFSSVSPSLTDCTQSASQVSCPIQDLEPGESARVEIELVAEAALVSSVDALVLQPAEEITLDNNAASGQIEVRRGTTSLRVVAKPNKKKVRSGSLLRLSVSGKNTGLASAKNATICVRVPRGIKPVDLDGGKKKGSAICWSAGDLGPESSQTFHPRFIVEKKQSVYIRERSSANAGNAAKVQGSWSVRVVGKSRVPSFTG